MLYWERQGQGLWGLKPIWKVSNWEDYMSCTENVQIRKRGEKVGDGNFSPFAKLSAHPVPRCALPEAPPLTRQVDLQPQGISSVSCLQSRVTGPS